MNKESSRGVSVPRITDARTAHTDEMHARMIKYSVSMGIRIVCLGLMFVVHGWLLWVVIAAAVVLPYFAVIIANAGSDTRNMTASDSMIDSLPPPAIEAPRPEEHRDSPETTLLHGEIVEDDPADGDQADSHHEDKAPPSA
ncbi:DUF3099 domain-containing protein [Arthrobacter sp. zg-Y820]|uniref:DUF3099 domain-containing protein n=1 Tax=unclassified Arthrobacter TaxID=235627 RepID=UPI001E57D630|nr:MULTISPECIES: DUF3099 domain-containing protein [unclassified Arthrobacter]MCC9196641.1 DUF3099 domain-containing protein [Arthrobacter sp. zg-Y820]MDK1279503.1 DUF3099 domain-containing protein [Arthrobacter sp. zg.Y820]WIB08120.1 DUF3099 domain-containing protein [Arthrobacter sp. zg-Y820]